MPFTNNSNNHNNDHTIYLNMGINIILFLCALMSLEIIITRRKTQSPLLYNIKEQCLKELAVKTKGQYLKNLAREV